MFVIPEEGDGQLIGSSYGLTFTGRGLTFFKRSLLAPFGSALNDFSEKKEMKSAICSNFSILLSLVEQTANPFSETKPITEL